MKYVIPKGATSVKFDVFIQDSSSSTGAGLTGLAYNTASLTAYYYRDAAASATSITLATMTLGTWASGGFVVVDGTNMPGWYQFCPPDACFATGAESVCFLLKGAANMAPLPIEVQLRSVPTDVISISGDATAADNLESAYDGTGYGDGATQTGCTTTTVVLASGSSSTTDYYVRKSITMLDGPAAGLDSIITAYNGTTKAATVSPAFTVSPTAGGGDKYVIGNAQSYTAALGTQAKADVNAEVLDVLTVDTNAELSALPGSSPTILQKLQYVYEYLRNKMTQTSTTQTLYKNDSSTPLGTASTSDDGTTMTKNRIT